MSAWLARWKRNGWRTADRKPVKNEDLWRALDVLAQAHAGALALGARPRRPSRERALRRARERRHPRPARQRQRRGRARVSRVAPFGAWRSPITAARVAAASVGAGRPRGRWRRDLLARGPAGRGRAARCSCAGARTSGAARRDAAALERAHARARVRRRIVRGRRRASSCFSPSPRPAAVPASTAAGRREPLTPPGAWRFADGVIDRRRRHAPLRRRGPRRDRRSLATASCGSTSTARGAPVVVARRPRFLRRAPPRAPTASTLAWIAWRHPDMPWDGTRALDRAESTRPVACVTPPGSRAAVTSRWSSRRGRPTGALHVVSDRTGWWNLYRLERRHAPRALSDRRRVRTPAVGLRRCAPRLRSTTARSCVACAREGGGASAASIRGDGRLDADRHARTREIAFAARGARAVPCSWARSPRRRPPSCVSNVADRALHGAAPGDAERRSTPPTVSAPEPFTFPSAGGRSRTALLPPVRATRAPGGAGGAPPLHRALPRRADRRRRPATLDPAVQFWTSRGFALLDVDYAGSSGYGRAYRRLLDGAWGVADVEDCVAAARFAVAQGWARSRAPRGARLERRGASPCSARSRSMTSSRPGASYYGIGDLEALRRETHKFESHYDQRLDRPLSGAARPLRRPLAAACGGSHPPARHLLPGTRRPGRAAGAGRGHGGGAAGAGHARSIYVPFPGEGHGFRRAETIVRALEAELAFYRDVLGLAPARTP